MRHGTSGEGGTRAGVHEEQQTPTASKRERALTSDLMAQVCERDNLNRAYKRVKANKGAPGVDGMTVSDLYAWLGQHKDGLIASLLDGSYQPQEELDGWVRRRLRQLVWKRWKRGTTRWRELVKLGVPA